MNWELFVGLRYLRSRRWHYGLSLISTISLVGVMIGVATLIIVLAVMAGLEDELRQKILGFNPHVTVVSYGGPITEWREKVAAIAKVPGVTAVSPVVYGQAMIGIGRSVSGVVVRGIDPASVSGVIEVGQHLRVGSVADLAKTHTVARAPDEGGGTVELGGILIGEQLARQLGVAEGDAVNVISPLGKPTPAGMIPRVKRFVVAGIFDSGMFE